MYVVMVCNAPILDDTDSDIESSKEFTASDEVSRLWFSALGCSEVEQATEFAHRALPELCSAAVASASIAKPHQGQSYS